MKSLKYLVSVLSVSILLASCASDPLKTANVAPTEDHGSEKSATAVEGGDGKYPTVQSDASKGDPNSPLNDPNSPLSKRSIYYDLDSFIIKENYKSTIEAHASYLQKHKDAKVIVQGNTDERGSREYNLSLGQKRAESVRRALKLLGVSDQQIEAVSFGEEKPKNPEHDEAAWSENRRSDLVYSHE
jgi:peptidoglycan-associated lipoprotein